MGATEGIECLLEIAIVRQRAPITRQKGLIIGVRDCGLFEHGDGLGLLPRGPERLAVLQRRVSILGIGAKAIPIEFYPVPGFGGATLFGLRAQRPRDIRHAVGLAATKPQPQNRRRSRRRKKSREAMLLK